MLTEAAEDFQVDLRLGVEDVGAGFDVVDEEGIEREIAEGVERCQDVFLHVVVLCGDLFDEFQCLLDAGVVRVVCEPQVEHHFPRGFGRNVFDGVLCECGVGNGDCAAFQRFESSAAQSDFRDDAVKSADPDPFIDAEWFVHQDRDAAEQVGDGVLGGQETPDRRCRVRPGRCRRRSRRCRAR